MPILYEDKAAMAKRVVPSDHLVFEDRIVAFKILQRVRLPASNAETKIEVEVHCTGGNIAS